MPRLAPRFDAPGYYARGDVRSAGAGSSATPHARPLVSATAQYTPYGHPANFASKRIGAGAGPERHTRYTQRGVCAPVDQVDLAQPAHHHHQLL